MRYRVISSGSSGNAILYHDSILIDCGVPFKLLKDFIKQIQIVVLTHKHSDHLNLKALLKIQELRPSVRVACCKWLVEELPNVRNIDTLEIGKLYNYGTFKLSPFKLYHDVENSGWRIFKDDYKIIHATDTGHLEGITAKGYDLYAIEHNYDENKAYEAIEEARKEGRYCHAIGSIETHLSWQQAREFIEKNKKESSEILELHKSNSFY
ncbi:MAG: MBL fold metallo-hydrolase [Bergeyella cardium]